MTPETLLAKFNLRGINYEPSTGGKAVFDLQEQLAMVGITWNHSPVGFLVLFVECLQDKPSTKALYLETFKETQKRMTNFAGTYPKNALNALVITAMAESTEPLGRLCQACGGSGKVHDNHKHIRPCQCCKDGRIAWNKETRFSVFCQTLPITYSAFRKYNDVLIELSNWLIDQRTAAYLELSSRIRKEKRACEVG